MSRCCTQGQENEERMEEWWPGGSDGGHLCTPPPVGVCHDQTRPDQIGHDLTDRHMRPTRWPEPSTRHRLPAWRAAETPTSPRKEGLCWAWHTGVGGLLCPSRMQTSSTAASTQLAAQQPACRHTQHGQGGVGSRGTGRRESSASLGPPSRRLRLAAAHPGAPLVPPATAPTAAAALRCILAGGAYPARQWSGPLVPCLADACWVGGLAALTLNARVQAACCCFCCCWAQLVPPALNYRCRSRCILGG